MYFPVNPTVLSKLNTNSFSEQQKNGWKPKKLAVTTTEANEVHVSPFHSSWKENGALLVLRQSPRVYRPKVEARQIAQLLSHLLEDSVSENLSPK